MKRFVKSATLLVILLCAAMMFFVLPHATIFDQASIMPLALQEQPPAEQDYEQFLSEFWEENFEVPFVMDQSGIVLTEDEENGNWIANVTNAAMPDGDEIVASGTFNELSRLLIDHEIPEEEEIAGVSEIFFYTVSGEFVGSSGVSQHIYGILVEHTPVNGESSFVYLAPMGVTSNSQTAASKADSVDEPQPEPELPDDTGEQGGPVDPEDVDPPDFPPGFPPEIVEAFNAMYTDLVVTRSKGIKVDITRCKERADFCFASAKRKFGWCKFTAWSAASSAMAGNWAKYGLAPWTYGKMQANNAKIIIAYAAAIQACRVVNGHHNADCVAEFVTCVNEKLDEAKKEE